MFQYFTMGKSFWMFLSSLVLLESVSSYRISEVSSAKSSNKTITDNTLRALLGKIKDYLTPVQLIPDEKYFSDTSKLHANASSHNVQITDLTVYSIDLAHADMSKLEFLFNLTFPAVNMTGLYNLYVENSLMVLRGHGNFSVTLKNLSLASNLTLALNANKTLEMKQVSSDFEFSYAHVNFENLGEDEAVSSFINDFINQFIVESMTSLKPTVEDMVNARLMSFGSFLVQGMTLDEFIDFINGLI